MDARVGKLLLIAAILQCLDPILTIAATLVRNPSVHLTPPTSARAPYGGMAPGFFRYFWRFW